MVCYPCSIYTWTVLRSLTLIYIFFFFIFKKEKKKSRQRENCRREGRRISIHNFLKIIHTLKKNDKIKKNYNEITKPLKKNK